MAVNVLKQVSRLPNEYQEVEYIESTGTQYINTNFIPTINSKMELVMACMNTSSLQNWSGVTLNAAAGYFRAGAFSDGNLNALFSVGGRQGVLTFPFDNNFHTYYISNGLQKIDNVESNNTIEGFTGEMVSVYLFKGNATYAYNPDDKQRIKSCKLWNGDTLVRYFVPCYRKSDNEIGLYDLVNDVFYINAGTETFLKGDDIPNYEFQKVKVNLISGSGSSRLPAEYQEVEYVESTGAQYIDTNVNLSSSDTVKCKFEITSSTTSMADAIYGSHSAGVFFVLLMRSPTQARVGTSSNQTTSTNYSLNTIYDTSLTNGTYIENGTTYTFTPHTGFTNLPSCYVMARHQNTSVPVSAKVYSFEIVGRFNGIPCYRKSDGVIGFYDLVSNTFFTNAGTGDFTKGNDVQSLVAQKCKVNILTLKNNEYIISKF